MPKSQKTKSQAQPREIKKTDRARATAEIAATQEEPTPPGGAGISPSKSYRSKAAGLTHKQKAALARHLMVRAGDLMEMEDAQLASEDLVGVDRNLMGSQLAAWVSYLPGAFWDLRLPQPSRARGRRKI